MNGAELFGASTKKRGGRPKGSLNALSIEIRDAITELTAQFDRMTVRQVFYQLVSAGIVPKTEQGGYRPVQRQVLQMRREKLLPWSFIADGTRWQRKPQSWNSAADYLDAVFRAYRRDLWQRQHVRIEVWLEKEALADVVYDVTDKWDVSLMPSRGQSSATFIYSAQQAAIAAEVPTYIYLLYDFDAGGNRAARTIDRELSFNPFEYPYPPEIPPVYVNRLAVTEEQIEEWDLPTRPAKSTDPEASKNPDYAVELDAIPPDTLKALLEDAILEHVDFHAWDIERGVEEEERKGLKVLATNWRVGDGK
jgi:hypothetical protein